MTVGDVRAAAVHVLKAVSRYGGIAAPTGPTDPQTSALVQQLAEDDRQHAAEDTEITRERKHCDRMLRSLDADPLAMLAVLPAPPRPTKRR